MLFLLLLTGCAPGGGGRGGGDDIPEPEADAGASDPSHADRGDIHVYWDPPATEDHATLERWFQDLGVVEAMADNLNETVALPRDLALIHGSCGVENAFYDPTETRLVICYEFIEMVGQTFFDAGYSGDELADAILSVWFFVFLHELGHAVVDLFDLPVLGREEDAVDGFATRLLVRGDQPRAALWAADFWSRSADANPSAAHFADEHSLNQQRFYNMLCWIYGSDPDNWQPLVDDGWLPEDRAARCPTEWANLNEDWGDLLAPWRCPTDSCQGP